MSADDLLKNGISLQLLKNRSHPKLNSKITVETFLSLQGVADDYNQLSDWLHQLLGLTDEQYLYRSDVRKKFLKLAQCKRNALRKSQMTVDALLNESFKAPPVKTVKMRSNSVEVRAELAQAKNNAYKIERELSIFKKKFTVKQQCLADLRSIRHNNSRCVLYSRQRMSELRISSKNLTKRLSRVENKLKTSQHQGDVLKKAVA